LISEESFDNSASCDVAIIGLAGRFPGARNVEEFWNNLKDGVEGISFFSDDEIVGPQDIPNLVKAKGTLSDVELFDAPFFDIPTREAQLMDPQQRLFLEAAWTALEDSGYDVSSYAGQIAVYAGVSTNTYLLTRMAQLNMGSPADHYSMILANEKDYLATRVSYKLNLRGESITVQTSCSTSLVAVHLACQSLLSGQSDMALAGGVSIGFPQNTGRNDSVAGRSLPSLRSKGERHCAGIWIGCGRVEASVPSDQGWRQCARRYQRLCNQ
jgi:acyl transferase domain-containing protein